MGLIDRPLRVLLLIPSLGKGGAERFVLDLCLALKARRDVEALIAVLYDQNDYKDLSRGLPVVRLGHQPFSLSRRNDYSSWRDLLISFQPDIVHTHLFEAEFLTSQYVNPTIAYVCHGHDNMPQFAPTTLWQLSRRQGLTRWIEKRYLLLRKYRHVRTAFIANSDHTLRYYRRVLPRPMRRDVHLIHYGFDYKRFKANVPRTLDAGRPVQLLNIGSLVDKKNQQLLVRVGQLLQQRGVDFYIDFLGDGPNRISLEAEVRRLDLGKQIKFRGNVDRVEDWLGKATLYVHTARYEPFGLVILEAMAAGLPSIVRDGQGNRELIVDGENGYLLRTEEPSVYADAVVALVRDPAKYTAVSAFAMEFAKRFDIEAATEKFVAFYTAWRSGAVRR